jgi:hypothetical protein
VPSESSRSPGEFNLKQRRERGYSEDMHIVSNTFLRRAFHREESYAKDLLGKTVLTACEPWCNFVCSRESKSSWAVPVFAVFAYTGAFAKEVLPFFVTIW